MATDTTYIGFYFEVSPLIPAQEILIAELSMFPFESMEETETGLKAYILKDEIGDFSVENLNVFQSEEWKIEYTQEEISKTNWNAQWEESFQPINVDDKLQVRASFHVSDDSFEEELVITPKMSFGTGHHETTHLMLEKMLQADWNNKKVMDAGCGTGILGIYAKKRGASKVVGFDIDDWSVENTEENCNLNNLTIDVYQGTVEEVEDTDFDVILANINKNILVHDLPFYYKLLQSGGDLYLSGIMEKDLEPMKKELSIQNFAFKGYEQRGEWLLIFATK